MRNYYSRYHILTKRPRTDFEKLIDRLVARYGKDDEFLTAFINAAIKRKPWLERQSTEYFDGLYERTCKRIDELHNK